MKRYMIILVGLMAILSSCHTARFCPYDDAMVNALQEENLRLLMLLEENGIRYTDNDKTDMYY